MCLFHVAVYAILAVWVGVKGAWPGQEVASIIYQSYKHADCVCTWIDHCAFLPSNSAALNLCYIIFKLVVLAVYSTYSIMGSALFVGLAALRLCHSSMFPGLATSPTNFWPNFGILKFWKPPV